MKCIACENEARTKKGWCSIGCYRLNQINSENMGRYKTGREVPLAEKEIHRRNSKRRWREDYDGMLATFQKAGCTPEANYKKGWRRNTKPTIYECEECGQKYTRRKNNSRIERFCSRKCTSIYQGRERLGHRRVEWTKHICQLCGNEYEICPSPTRSPTKYCSRKCHNIGNYLSMPKQRTGIEMEIADILKELDISFEEQKLLEALTIADFFVEPKIAIYADGDYWHNKKNVRQRDGYINKVLMSQGYTVLRYRGSEIRTNREAVKNHLREQLCLQQ